MSTSNKSVLGTGPFFGWFCRMIIKISRYPIILAVIIGLIWLDVFVGSAALNTIIKTPVRAGGYRVEPTTITLVMSIVMSGIQTFIGVIWIANKEMPEVQRRLATMVFALFFTIDALFDGSIVLKWLPGEKPINLFPHEFSIQWLVLWLTVVMFCSFNDLVLIHGIKAISPDEDWEPRPIAFVRNKFSRSDNSVDPALALPMQTD